MKHYIEVLYEGHQHDKVFGFLKQSFGTETSNVSVDPQIPEEYVRIEWQDIVDPIELAHKMTTAIPDIIIETASDSGIESTARFFNGTQLW